MSGTSLSIVVPTFNEADNVVPFVGKVREALKDISWEILFVDDNSTDGTPSIVYELSQSDPRVRLILRLADRGLAKSSIQGMLSACGSLICVMDGDGQHDPAVIPDLVTRLESRQLEIVSAARRLEDDSVKETLGKYRKRLSQVANRLSSLAIGRNIVDPMTGFFLIRRAAFLDVAPRLGDAGFKLLLDILYTGKNLRHEEVPFEFGHRLYGESKLDSFVIWRFMTFLLSKMTSDLLPASLISFLIIGASGVVVHFSVLYAVMGLFATFAAAQLVAALVAATSNYLLNNRLTFSSRRLRGWPKFFGYLKFLGISSFGILANVSAASLTCDRVIHSVLIATLAGIAIDTIWKFVVADRLIWR